MNKVKNIWKRCKNFIGKCFHRRLFAKVFGKRTLYLAIVFAGLFLLCMGTNLYQNHIVSNLKDETVKERWTKENDYALVSVFFPQQEDSIDENTLIGTQHSIEQTLSDLSMTTSNPSQRLFVTNYYERGSMTLTRGENQVTVETMGIMEDFFLFHPAEFVSGNGLVTDGCMSDYVVLDEKTAFQLFGAIDVAGMSVTIQGSPHIVSGVVKNTEEKLLEEAGKPNQMIYASIQSLNSYGSTTGIACYELLCPEPYDGFALQTLQTVFDGYKDSAEFIDNSKRFEVAHEWKVLTSLRTRSMQTKAIVYPYWENVSRHYENIFAIFLLFRGIVYITLIIFVLILVIIKWKHKLFTKEDIQNGFIRLIEKGREKRKMRRKEGKRL